jgi:hypothetical protein
MDDSNLAETSLKATAGPTRVSRPTERQLGWENHRLGG